MQVKPDIYWIIDYSSQSKSISCFSKIDDLERRTNNKAKNRINSTYQNGMQCAYLPNFFKEHSCYGCDGQYFCPVNVWSET